MRDLSEKLEMFALNWYCFLPNFDITFCARRYIFESSNSHSLLNLIFCKLHLTYFHGMPIFLWLFCPRNSEKKNLLKVYFSHSWKNWIEKRHRHLPELTIYFLSVRNMRSEIETIPVKFDLSLRYKNLFSFHG